MGYAFKNRFPVLAEANGYSLVEAMVGMALLGLAAVAAGSAIKTIFSGVAGSTGKTSHTLMRAQLIQALSNSSTCAGNLVFTSAIPAVQGANNPLPINQIKDASGNIFYDRAAPTYGIIDGIQYDPVLQYPSTSIAGSADEMLGSPGTGRTFTTLRYQAAILLRGQQQNQNSTHKSSREFLGSPDFVAEIPISIEIEKSGGSSSLFSCTVNPNDTDEVLATTNVSGIPSHTARECVRDGGFPFPTGDSSGPNRGMTCRFPLPLNAHLQDATTAPPAVALTFLTTSSWGSTNPMPACPLNWKPYPDAGRPYTTTVASDVSVQKCGNTSYAATSYHEFARVAWPGTPSNFDIAQPPAEAVSYTADQGAGGGAGVNLGWIAGGMTALAVGLAAGPAGVAAGLLIFAIMSVSSSGHCPPSQTYYVYSQPIAIGCQ